ncbi:hypothetical protein [Nocardia sp. NPDC059239]|uniref:cupin domain-containing protein n=1 Tax=unclassified Nocardia TaxID=2637762 RepID=UPI0036758880
MRKDFVGALQSRTLGSIQLSEVSSGDVVVSRTIGMIRRSDPGLVKIGMQVTGRGIVRQGGHEAVLAPGDFAIYDTARPYQVEFAGPCAMFATTCGWSWGVPPLTFRKRETLETA